MYFNRKKTGKEGKYWIKGEGFFLANNKKLSCKTSLIKDRFSALKFCTFSGSIYELVDAVDLNGMAKSGFPESFWKNFMHGIPQNWLQLISEYNSSLNCKEAPLPVKKAIGKDKITPKKVIVKKQNSVSKSPMLKKSPKKDSHKTPKSPKAFKDAEKGIKNLPATPLSKELKSFPQTEPSKKNISHSKKNRRLSEPLQVTETKLEVRRSSSGRNVVKPVCFWMNERKANLIDSPALKRKWTE